ncbi:MAG: lysine exporter LysO family protein [Desulfovibrionaceae bacterium]|nr:lysine exporter LysO family protein [Desulfovibrionaceae bacterium]
MKESIKIIILFLLGILCGYYKLIPYEFSSSILTISVCIILFCSGMTIGFNKSTLGNIRHYGVRAIMLPLCTVVCVLFCSFLLWTFYLDLPLYSALAASSGFCYYSLSSALVEELFSVELAALVLLTNMIMEIFVLLFAPVFAWLCGPLAPIAIAGVSALDICLPAIMRSSGKEYFIYAVIHGVSFELLSPLCIYLFYFLSQM